MAPDRTTASFLETLDRLCQRPGMFVGRPSLRLVQAFLDGYDAGTLDNALTSPLDGFRAWIYLKYGIYHPAWSWARVLLHAAGDEHAAISLLPTLYRQFVEEREAAGGADALDAELDRRYAPLCGSEPETTSTTPDY